MNMKRFEGKVAVVTGGNSGIGLATAKRLQEEGARVAIVGRSKKTLDEAVKTIGNGGGAGQADVSVPKDLARLHATGRQKFCKIAIFFGNPAILQFSPFAATSPDLYHPLVL